MTDNTCCNIECDTPEPVEFGKIILFENFNCLVILLIIIEKEIDKRLYNRVDVASLPEIEVPEGLLKDHIVLRKHQRQGVRWMIKQENDPKIQGGILADEMGLGMFLLISIFKLFSFNQKRMRYFVLMVR